MSLYSHPNGGRQHVTHGKNPLLVSGVIFWLCFEGFLTAFFGIPALHFITHFIFIMGFFAVVVSLEGSPRIKKYAVVFGFYIFVLSAVSVLGWHIEDPVISVVAVLLYLKIGFVFISAKRLTIESLGNILFFISLIHLLGVALSYIYYDYFFYLRKGDIYDRWDRILGLQMNSNALAFLSAVLGLFFLFVERRVALAFVLILSIILSESRSALLFFAVASVYLGFVEGRFYGRIVVLAAIAVAIIGVIVFSDRIEDTFTKIKYTIDHDGLYVRAAMLIGGARLAMEYFPVGSGGGTFGSPLASEMGAYVAAGIQHLPTVIDRSGVHDSGVGSVLGEYGCLGAVTVIGFLVMIIKELGGKRLTKLDVLMIVAMVVLLSFFRGIVSSYFYSGVVAFLTLMVGHVREGALRRVQPDDR